MWTCICLILDARYVCTGDEGGEMHDIQETTDNGSEKREKRGRDEGRRGSGEEKKGREEEKRGSEEGIENNDNFDIIENNKGKNAKIKRKGNQNKSRS
jgi:hypothetical protein